MKLRVWLYRKNIKETRRLPLPVISIGNLTLGGTGKTPMTIWVAKALLKQGRKPAVLSRGYRSKTKNSIDIVSDGSKLLMTPELSGDEPAMMARHLKGVPIIIGKDRYASGQLAIKDFKVDTLILDDGYQRLDVFRNLNILLMDHSYKSESDSIFPAGTLREPLEELRRADLVCFTRVELGRPGPSIEDYIEPETQTIKCQTEINELNDLEKTKTMIVEEINGIKVCAFCGIAQPDKFKKLLESYGAQVVSFIDYPDHHTFKEVDIKKIEESAKKFQADMILTTEKDSVKLLNLTFSLPLYSVVIGLKWLDGESVLNEFLSNESNFLKT